MLLMLLSPSGIREAERSDDTGQPVACRDQPARHVHARLQLCHGRLWCPAADELQPAPVSFLRNRDRVRPLTTPTPHPRRVLPARAPRYNPDKRASVFAAASAVAIRDNPGFKTNG